MNKIFFFMAAALTLANAGRSDDVCYRLERKFVPATVQVPPGKLYDLIVEGKKLTTVVGPESLTITSSKSREYESVSWGLDDPSAAWKAALSGTGYPIAQYDEAFDDPGWIKGSRYVHGKHGAFIWMLQNRITFKTSDIYYETGGGQYPIQKVYVGSAGDYEPNKSISLVFPVLDDPSDVPEAYPAYDFPTSDPPTKNRCVKYNYDLTTYYKLAPAALDLDALEPDSDFPDMLIPVPDAGERKPGALMINHKTKLLIRDPCVRNGVLTLEWQDISPDKRLLVNGQSSPVQVPCTGSWPKTNSVQSIGCWGPDEYIDVRMIHTYIGGSDIVRLVPCRVDLIPNYDRDSDIDNDDRKKLYDGETFYFWANDDNDFGHLADDFSGVADVPGIHGGQRDCDTAAYSSSSLGTVYFKPDGLADMPDFFPVYLDLRNILNRLGKTAYRYVLKKDGAPLNCALDTKLTRWQADAHLHNYEFCKQFQNTRIYRIPTGGLVLPQTFLEDCEQGLGLVYMEANASHWTGCTPIILEVRDIDNKIILKREMPLSTSSIEMMFRHINIRDKAGGSGGAASRSKPKNYPDSLCNDKNFIFVHGYNVNGTQARGWHSEFFKRMFWSGSNAKFHAVSWRGDESQIMSVLYPALGMKSPLYHNNVVNAGFKTAGALKEYLSSLNSGGKSYIAAHSLGNMLVSEAILQNPQNIDLYFMLDAAVAAECYATNTQHADMVHYEWDSYDEKLYTANWYKTFINANDIRATLTWQKKYTAISPKIVNMYSSGDQVFAPHKRLDPPNTFEGYINGGSGRFAWAFQEKRKGAGPFFCGGNTYTYTHNSGWSFSKYTPPNGWRDPDTGKPYEASFANSLTLTQIRDMPFFGIANDPDLYYKLYTGDKQAASDFLTEEKHWRLLAGSVPALSLAAGRTSIPGLGAMRNIDMNSSTIKSTHWISRGIDPWKSTQWWHNDIKNQAYIFTYKAYDKIVELGGLK